MTAPPDSTAARRPAVWQLAWRASQHKPRHFWIGSVGFFGFFTLPLVAGWLLARAFDAVAASRPADAVRIVAALVAVEVLRMVTLHVGIVWFLQSWEHIRGLLRGNMLVAQLANGGSDAGRPVASPAESVARFREDTDDIAWFIDTWLDVAGAVAFTVVALGVLASVDRTAAAMMLLPMVAVGVIASRLGRRLRLVHRADRRAAGAVAGLLGDAMAAPVTIEVNQAARSVLARLDRLGRHRLGTAVRSRVYQDAIRSFGASTSDIGLGLVMIAIASSVGSGRFGVGEIALFLAYGAHLGFLPRMLGLLVARRHQAEVAFEEMGGLVARSEPASLVTHRHFPFDDRAPTSPQRHRPVAIPLERLEIDGLGARYQRGGGLAPVDLVLDRGSFTVVTGPIGSGKTTLLRVLLGLCHEAEVSGVVRWNGRVVEDRAAFFVPPRSAYIPQVPHLLSDSLADNVLLGGDELEGDRLAASVAAAALEADLDAMAAGAATVVGPRGVRLSGGQRQRVAAARALAARADLLVVDDLSSALDVETELSLWANLARSGATVLAVSHRPVAFERADQIVTLVSRAEPSG